MACQLLSEPKRTEAGKSIMGPPLHIKNAGGGMHSREKLVVQEVPAGYSRNSGNWKLAIEGKPSVFLEFMETVHGQITPEMKGDER